jgi:hypothetical protein
MDGKPDLYHHGTSVCSAKARLALEEKGVEWNSKYLDVRIGEQQNPEYLKLNPKAQVPTMVHDGNVIRDPPSSTNTWTRPFRGLRSSRPSPRQRRECDYGPNVWIKVFITRTPEG